MPLPLDRPAPRASATGTSVGILAILSFCHLLNDLMQSLRPAIYPVLKSGFGLDFGPICSFLPLLGILALWLPRIESGSRLGGR